MVKQKKGAAKKNVNFTKSYSREIHFIVIFSVSYTIFILLYFMVPDSFLSEVIYNKVIVSVSSDIINLFAPVEGTIAVGNRLVSSNTTLEIVRGCDGAGATFLLMAAVLAFSASLKEKIVGLVGALALVYVINQFRLIGIYFIVAYEYDWFQIVHSYLAPTIIIIINCIFFLWWVKWTSRSGLANEQLQPA